MKRTNFIRKLIVWLLILGVLLNFSVSAYSAVPDENSSYLQSDVIESHNLELEQIESEKLKEPSFYDIADPCVDDIEFAAFDEEQFQGDATRSADSEPYIESSIYIDINTYDVDIDAENNLEDLDDDEYTDFANMFECQTIIYNDKTYQLFPFMTESEFTSGLYPNM